MIKNNFRFDSKTAHIIKKSSESLKETLSNDFETTSCHNLLSQLPSIIDKINTHASDLSENDYRLLCFMLLHHMECLKNNTDQIIKTEEIPAKKRPNKKRKISKTQKKLAEELFHQFMDYYD